MDMVGLGGLDEYGYGLDINLGFGWWK